MTSEQIKDKYEQRIVNILKAIAAALQENTTLTVSEPCEMHDDDFKWEIFAKSPADKEANELSTEAGTDITFTIAESEQWDGEKNGVNFMIDVVSVEGSIIGGLIPYNYTPDVWVSCDDGDAIEERFKIMEQADVSGVVHMIVEHYKGRDDDVDNDVERETT